MNRKFLTKKKQNLNFTSEKLDRRRIADVLDNRLFNTFG